MTGPLATYTETLTYDSYERVSTRSWTRDGLTFPISYQYNTASGAIQLTYPSGRVVAYNYGTNGMLSTITEPASQQTPGGTYLSSITQNVAGQVTGFTLGNGVSQTYGYDSNRMQFTSQTAV